MGAVSYGPGRGLDPGVGPVGAPPGEHRVAVGVDCDLGLERVLPGVGEGLHGAQAPGGFSGDAHLRDEE